MYINEKYIKTINKKVTYHKKVNINSLQSGAIKVSKSNKPNKPNKTNNKENI